MKRFFVLLIVVSLMVSLVGCNQSEVDESSDDMTLTVYAGMQEDHALLAVQEFEKATGIKTEMVRMSGGEIFSRIKAEKDNPSASVWYGGGALTFMAADNEGLLENYVSPEAANISDQLKDENGAWTGIY